MQTLKYDAEMYWLIKHEHKLMMYYLLLSILPTCIMKLVEIHQV